LRVNVFCGRNASVYGIDVGIGNKVEERAGGFQAGLVNLAGELEGIEAGVVNKVEERVEGIQVGLASLAGQLYGMQMSDFNRSRGVAGAQIASMFNEAEKRIKGVQRVGIVNLAGEIAGAQIAGIHNQSESVVGAQIGGIVNDAENLAGLQIGILNFNRSGPLPFFPIFNFGFGGSDDGSDEDEESED
jgi:hypothetical protein